MIRYNWTYSCDHCEEVVHEKAQFLFYANQPIIIPNPVPGSVKNGLWRNVDGRLVCPKQIVTVEDIEIK